MAGAAIAALGAVAASKMSADSASSSASAINASNEQQYMSEYEWREAKSTQEQNRYRVQIQQRVQDAKAAGIHPLYALGATQSSSPGGAGPLFSSGGQHPSGSGLGTGVAAAARALGSGVARAGAAKERQVIEAAQVAAYTAAANRDNAYAQKALSETKMAEQSALSMRGIPGELGSAQAWPLGKGPKGSPLEKRYVIRSPGGNVTVDPRYSGSQAMEDRYGEIADYVHGFPLYMRERFTQNPKSWFNWKTKPLPRSKR